MTKEAWYRTKEAWYRTKEAWYMTKEAWQMTGGSRALVPAPACHHYEYMRVSKAYLRPAYNIPWIPYTHGKTRQGGVSVE